MIDVTHELPKNKYGTGVTVVKIAASDKPGQDLRSHFPVRNITTFLQDMLDMLAFQFLFFGLRHPSGA